MAVDAVCSVLEPQVAVRPVTPNMAASTRTVRVHRRQFGQDKTVDWFEVVVGLHLRSIGMGSEHQPKQHTLAGMDEVASFVDNLTDIVDDKVAFAADN